MTAQPGDTKTAQPGDTKTAQPGDTKTAQPGDTKTPTLDGVQRRRLRVVSGATAPGPALEGGPTLQA
jgi:hypothetical protein